MDDEFDDFGGFEAADPAEALPAAAKTPSDISAIPWLAASLQTAQQTPVSTTATQELVLPSKVRPLFAFVHTQHY